MSGLVHAFHDSERLHRHIQFLYANGSIYNCFNQNLLFHGCIPLEEDGSFTAVTVNHQTVKGKELMDVSEKIARKAYFGSKKGAEKQNNTDYMWSMVWQKIAPVRQGKDDYF